MNTTQLIVPMTFMLNLHENNHQKMYDLPDAFFDLGGDSDASAWREFVPKSVCCVIKYANDDVPITAPSKIIQFELWRHESTEFCKRKNGGEECFVFRGEHLRDFKIQRSVAQADCLTKDLFNNEGDFKQFKIRRSVG